MPPRQRPAVTLATVAATGDRLETLRALRDTLARALSASDCAARDVAALTGRLQSVLAEIDELTPPPEVKGNPLDELNRRRAARGSAPARTSESKVGR